MHCLVKTLNNLHITLTDQLANPPTLWLTLSHSSTNWWNVSLDIYFVRSAISMSICHTYIRLLKAMCPTAQCIDLIRYNMIKKVNMAIKTALIGIVKAHAANKIALIRGGCYIVRLFTTKVEQLKMRKMTDRQTITHNAKLWKAKSYNEIYDTDNLKYSKMTECLSLADIAKPYFSRSFIAVISLSTTLSLQGDGCMVGMILQNHYAPLLICVKCSITPK